MIIRKSFKENKPTLYLVATPIGNLKDITLRALEVLKQVDFLYAEDTRVTKKLLDHFEIKKALQSYHMHNEEERVKEITEHLENGFNVAFCSDAGMPSISDPGYLLVNSLKANYNVVVIPGASASLTALVGSGLIAQPFSFIGFLPPKQTARKNILESLKNLNHTLIFFESAIKLEKTLNDLYKHLGKRKCVVARELTKMYETYYEFNLGEDISLIEKKGEIVIVVEGAPVIEVTDELIVKTLKNYLNKELSTKEAVYETSLLLNVNKNRVYKLALENKL